MKIARKRYLSAKRVLNLFNHSPKPRYRLSDLLAQMPPGRMELPPDLQAWENMAPVGREFGADPVEQMRTLVKEGTGPQATNTSIKPLVNDDRD